MKRWIAAAAMALMLLLPAARMEAAGSRQPAYRPRETRPVPRALYAAISTLSSAERLDSRTLSEAVNVDGGTLTFELDADEAVWPMVPAQVDGRSVLQSGNTSVDGSTAAVHATVTAAEGDALAFDFRTSCEAVYDNLSVAIDGASVKWFTGEHAWTTWAIALPEGEHRISFTYEKDEYNHAGEDCAIIDDVRLLHGEAARAALEGLPVFPVSERFDMTLLDDAAREVALDDPDHVADGIFGKRVRYYIVNSKRETLELTLTAASDPERAFVYHAAEGSSIPLARMLTADRSTYRVTLPMNRDVEGARYNCVYAYSGVMTDQGEETAVLVLFSGEAGAEDFMNSLAQNGIDMRWHYTDEVPSSDNQRPKLEPGQYRVFALYDRNL